MDLSNYYNKGYKILCDYREQGVHTIDTKEFYKNFLDPESYNEWENWEFNRIDVSDEYYKSLSPLERQNFRKKEMGRLNYGLWKTSEGFQKLSEASQKELIDKYPMAGKIQVLTASHYFFLNYMKVDSTDSRIGVTTPSFYRREAFFYLFKDIMQYYELEPGQDRGIINVKKARSTHFSTTVAADVIKEMLTQQNYKYGIGLDVQSKVTEYAKKIEFLYNSLPEWIKQYNPITQKSLFKRTGTNVITFTMDFWDYNKNRIDERYQNTIQILNHDPGSWESPRFKKIVIDEAGRCPHDINELIDKANSTMLSGDGQKVGLCIIGGTSNENDEKNRNAHTTFIDDPKLFKMFTFFAGKHHFINADKRGWTNEDVVVEELLKRRAELEESGNISALMIEIVQRPIYATDCVYSPENNFLNIPVLQNRLKYIRECLNNSLHIEHYTIQRGIFRAIASDVKNVQFVPDPNGPWYIIEHPQYGKKNLDKPNIRYFAGADNVDDSIGTSDLIKIRKETFRKSMQCVLVHDSITDTPVAYYLDRNTDPKVDYHQALLGCCYYNCYFFPEHNKPNMMTYFKEYADQNYYKGYFYRYLFPTPTKYGGNWGRAKNRSDVKFGFYTGNKKSDYYVETLVPWVMANVNKLWFPELIEVLCKWNIGNKKNTPDLGMAFLITLLGVSEFNQQPQLKANPNYVSSKSSDWAYAVRNL